MTGLDGEELSVNVGRTETIKDVRYKVQEKLAIGRTRTSSIIQLFIGEEILEDETRCSSLDLAGNESVMSYMVEACSSCPSLVASSSE